MHISFFNKKTRFVFQTMHISFCLDYIYNGWYDPQLTIKPADSNDSTYAKNYDGQVAAPWRRR